MKKAAYVLLVLALVVLLIVAMLRFGGELLVAADPLDGYGDALVVLLMGGLPARVLGAADLYHEGFDRGIVMVRSRMIGAAELAARGIALPGEVDNNAVILEALGVPGEKIQVLPGAAESTKDEALILAAYLAGRDDVKSIVLVTSKFHSRRAQLIFSAALAPLGVTVASAPTPYDPFRPRGWYRYREDASWVFFEYAKLLHFFLLEQFQIRAGNDG